MRDHQSTPNTNGTDGLDINRRSLLKGIGGTAVAVGMLTGTASAHSSQFFGCGRVCTDTDGNIAVVATGDGYEGRELDAATGEDGVAWSHDNTYCYEASGDEKVVAFIEEDQWRPGGETGEGCTLCVNPNECASNHHGGPQEIIDDLDESTIGVCAGNLTVGDCTVVGSDGDQAARPAPDVPLLNYALTLEHLEYAFYRDALEEFADDELMEADVLSSFGETVQRQVPEYLATIRDHEAAHVDALSETIDALGGSPVDEGEYDFGYETPTEFLATAQALEDTGVAAYTGAAPQLVDNDVLGAAASIQSVEARHASFLRLVNGEVPFPAVLEEAKSVEEVLEIAGQFITSSVDPGRYELRGNRPEPDRKADDDTSDLEVLNYALTLEHLENAFYREALETFSDEELMDADVLSEYGEGVRETVPEFVRTVGDHEAAHVEAITDTVESLGGTPVEEASYDFGYASPSEFLGVAAALETTGVSAYRGAAPTVENDDVFAAAVAIHAVEARHSAYFNELNLESPFPRAVDEPLSMEEVLEIAGPFIVEE